ncbi:hypothetical protein TBLA_0C00390 [Henningerozyma blattae CBS 6284]|uniref:VASt domain-containing protein n=1 Tax=Henningerozyma blattae (strain ATCC 34711 / CBS 6284 / DSM 70876 / NBRC 10599 / NRRL Y-10934 / UCD 77-7) TaxID=1071380 RepID=I2H0F3_HENB6|nr:hypothetical protein TBLA_0C00390 [Tetrapisispora blattae CBS 6284]CCH59855.1 hypothetical protein TBLA_0C00390 [Tetrapisispora blattae CBS 6284]
MSDWSDGSGNWEPVSDIDRDTGKQNDDNMELKNKESLIKTPRATSDDSVKDTHQLDDLNLNQVAVINNSNTNDDSNIRKASVDGTAINTSNSSVNANAKYLSEQSEASTKTASVTDLNPTNTPPQNSSDTTITSNVSSTNKSKATKREAKKKTDLKSNINIIRQKLDLQKELPKLVNHKSTNSSSITPKSKIHSDSIDNHSSSDLLKKSNSNSSSSIIIKKTASLPMKMLKIDTSESSLSSNKEYSIDHPDTITNNNGSVVGLALSSKDGKNVMPNKFITPHSTPTDTPVTNNINLSTNFGSMTTTTSNTLMSDNIKTPVLPPEEPEENKSFFNNVFSSFAKRQTASLQSPDNMGPKSPDIISHRREKSTSSRKGTGNRIKSSSSTNSNNINNTSSYRNDSITSVNNSNHSLESPLKEDSKPKEFYSIRDKKAAESTSEDPKLYSNKKYLDTIYHYTSDERNRDFHNIFEEISSHDCLIDDFSCTLSKDFLYQGRIYISEEHLSFNSKILSWVSKITIPFKEITFIEKTSAAGLFPNAISIETKEGRTQFNGFTSRDTTFDIMKEVWSRTLLSQLTENDYSRNSSKNPSISLTPAEALERHLSRESVNRSSRSLDALSKSSSEISLLSENESLLEEDDGHSIDENGNEDYDEKKSLLSSVRTGEDTVKLTNIDRFPNEHEYEITDAINNEQHVSNDVNDGDDSTRKHHKVYKLKPSSSFTYTGPDFNPTITGFPPELMNNSKEHILGEAELNAPPGVVFHLLFDNKNTKFWEDFLKTQGGYDFATIPGFFETNEKNQKFRKYEYFKSLNYSVGPKSTKCEVVETIIHLDYNGYINVVNTIKTPDVPSGNNFVVNTRYLFRWNSFKTSMLRVSFWIEWTGGSWIKSMIESSCKATQTNTTNDLIPFINKYIDTHTEESRVTYKSVNLTNGLKTKKQSKTKKISKPTKIPEQAKINNKLLQKIMANKEILIILCFVLLVFLNIFAFVIFVNIIKINKNIKFIKDSSIFQIVELFDKLSDIKGGLLNLKQATNENLDINGIKSNINSVVKNWVSKDQELGNENINRIMQSLLDNIMNDEL